MTKRKAHPQRCPHLGRKEIEEAAKVNDGRVEFHTVGGIHTAKVIKFNDLYMELEEEKMVYSPLGSAVPNSSLPMSMAEVTDCKDGITVKPYEHIFNCVGVKPRDENEVGVGSKLLENYAQKIVALEKALEGFEQDE